MKRILIVDDDGELRSHLAEILKGAGYWTDEAANGLEAAEKAAADDFDVVLLDLIMPKGNGSDALVELRKIAPQSRVIVMTAFATIENAVEAVKRGASDYLSKPFKIEGLLTAVRRAIEEASFEECKGRRDLDCILSSLSNPIRTKILWLLHIRKNMRLMEIAKELGIEDHTKVIFHLKIMKESGMIEHGRDKLYALSKEGEKTVGCLKILENHLSQPRS